MDCRNRLRYRRYILRSNYDRSVSIVLEDGAAPLTLFILNLGQCVAGRSVNEFGRHRQGSSRADHTRNLSACRYGAECSSYRPEPGSKHRAYFSVALLRQVAVKIRFRALALAGWLCYITDG